jgi:hypothetical protein
VFEGIDRVQARVLAVQFSSNAFHVTIRGLDIADTFNSGPMIEVRVGQPGPFGPVVFEVANNRLTIPAASQHFGTDAISIQGGNASSTTNAGIQFYQFGPGISQVRFLDNLVAGQTSLAGVPGSLVMSIFEGDATFEIVNNTTVSGNRGIQVNGESPIAAWRGVIADNIVAGMSNNGMSIVQPATPGAVANDHNLLYNVSQNFFTAGPGTLFVDPLFVPGYPGGRPGRTRVGVSAQRRALASGTLQGTHASRLTARILSP